MNFQCASCDKTFTKKGNLMLHLQTVHEKLRHFCDKCDKSYSTERSLKEHKQKEHTQSDISPNKAEKIEKYSCKPCKETFVLKESLEKHNNYFHNSNSLKMTCGYCKKEFFSMEKL